MTHDEQSGSRVLGGLRDLTLLNTTDSEFRGFARDDYTTLAETTDRMLATASRRGGGSPGRRLRLGGGRTSAARQALIAAFVDTYSHSLQQTPLRDGRAGARRGARASREVRLALPNKHHFLVDLSPFGLDNPDEVFLAADRPYGLIEGQRAGRGRAGGRRPTRGGRVSARH